MKISLKAARINAQMKQVDAAKQIGVSRAALISWETGKTSPKIENVIKLCQLYGVSTEDIFLPSKFA